MNPLPWPLTFRSRLTLRWTLAFGILLALANAAIYATMRSYLYHDLDVKVRTVAATELASSTDRAQIHLHEPAIAALEPGEYTDKFVQIFEADGRLRLASIRVQGQPGLVTADVVRAAVAGQAPLVSLTIEGHPARATVLGTQLNGEHYAVMVGLFADEVSEHLTMLARLLFGVWVIGLTVTAGLGYTLASSALQPVTAITSRAARIARGEFSTRLDVSTSRDEVGDMTRSLNTVLERLHGALEANQRFAADASHELRGPLTAMAGEVDVTLKHERTTGEYRDALGHVRERIGALSKLTEDLILLVRAHEGAAGVELRELSLRHEVDESVARVMPAAAGRHITFETQRTAGLLVYSDPRLFARVLDNVLTNAAHYDRDGGRVIVAARLEDAGGEWTSATVVVTVSDTGQGIPPADHERVFERFYRVDPSRTRRSGGSGLGLAICREILTALSGSIRVAASSSDGTVIEIRLPGTQMNADEADAAQMAGG